MRFLAHLVCLSTALAAPLLTVEPIATVVPGHYIVKLKQEQAAFSTNAIESMKKSLSTTPKFEYSIDGFHGFAGQLSDTELADMKASEHVEYIEQDIKVNATHLVCQDSATWGISRISHREPGNTTYIFDDSAGEGTCAYVLDTGIFIEHPDFEGRAQHLVNFSGEESKKDDVGHGTHVAGTIGSRTYGVAKKTQLYAVKVLDSSGSGSISAILAGIDFVTRDAAQRSSTKCPKGVVANISFGGPKNYATNQAVAAAVAKGVFFAVAAGNDGIDARYVSPASEPSACAVGATALNESMADWSNFGPSIAVLAPGVAITSLSNDGGTAVQSGTSMAAPHVAGLAAYLLSLQGVGTQGLCGRIAAMATKGVVKDLKELTPNLLINNGALGD